MIGTSHLQPRMGPSKAADPVLKGSRQAFSKKGQAFCNSLQSGKIDLRLFVP
jgi:hypothetical protein